MASARPSSAAEAILRFEFNSSISARSGWRACFASSACEASTCVSRERKKGEAEGGAAGQAGSIRASWDCGLQCPRTDPELSGAAP